MTLRSFQSVRRAFIASSGLLSLLTCLAVPAPAHAQNRQPQPERAWYAAFAITNSSIAVCDIFGCLYPHTDEPDTGLSMSLGRQLTRHAAIELEYVDPGTPAWGDPSLFYNVDISGYRVSFIWDFPFRGRWTAYVQGGLTRFDAHSRANTFDYSMGRYTRRTIESRRTGPSLGGGGELRISSRWSLRFGLESSDLDDRLLDQRQGTIGSFLIGARRVF